MKRALHMITVLTLTSGITGALLAFVYAGTWPKIQQNERAQLERAVYQVLPGAVAFEEQAMGDISLFRGFSDSTKSHIVGIAVRAQGTGFQDVIRVMAGFDQTCGRMFGLRVLKQVETPGLGAKIAEEEFLRQFEDLVLSPKIAVVKAGALDKSTGRVQAITGATISSKAVESIINKALDTVRQGQGGGT
ncbi:MAG: RnfABCDGE type electron transport complex subunit G [Candidatus Eisenbacteria bacterium]|nr:RnfABCDGE type electron transport complex subunit G [Candidatus Eisenbacteria bacterium]